MKEVNMKKALIALAVLFLMGPVAKATAGAAEGEAVWKSVKCSNCHNQNDKKKVGPGLAGALTRADEAWVKAWLADPEAAWKANEGYMVTLKTAMGKAGSPKPAHKTRKLTEPEINDLVEFLKTFK
jgi:cytochrome c2